MSSIIKVGFLLSYDYNYLKDSLPCVYQDADTITLSVDQDFRTWTGNYFTIEPSFFKWLTAFDVDKKITIYKDNFYAPELSVMECDTRQRNMMANFMGDGGWHIQIDADEYFVEFSKFVRFLKSKRKHLVNPKKKPVTVIANWVVLYRKTDQGFLYVKNCRETLPIATNHPSYEVARNSSHPCIYTNFFLFHQTWARTEEEIYQKLKNWSHKNDFDTEKHFEFWRSINESNYEQVKDFHPIYGSLWQALDYAKGSTVQEFIQNYRKQNKLSLRWQDTWLKNNLVLEKFYNRLAAAKKNFLPY